MDISATHETARRLAARSAALQASQVLLETGTGQVTLALYGAPRPLPGDTPAADALVNIVFYGATSLDQVNGRILLPVPSEGLITAAGIPAWGRVFSRLGDWWADVSVTDDAGSGEIRLKTLDFKVGAFAQITDAAVRGW